MTTALASIDFRSYTFSRTGTPNLEIFFLLLPVMPTCMISSVWPASSSPRRFSPFFLANKLVLCCSFHCVLERHDLGSTNICRFSVVGFFPAPIQARHLGHEIGVNRQSEDPQLVCVCEASLLIFPWSCGDARSSWLEISADCASIRTNSIKSRSRNCLVFCSFSCNNTFPVASRMMNF